MIPVSRLWFKILLLVAFTVPAISADAQVKADFDATPLTGCSPMVVYFRDASTGDSLSYYWDLGNGTISYLQHPIATYFDPGKYSIKLVVKNKSGSDSLIKNQFIVVNAPPTVSFKASDSLGCFPLRVNFTEFSTPGSGTIVSYEWDFGDGTLSDERNPSHTYTNIGNFTVTLRVYNSNGCVKVFTKPSFIKTSDGVKADFSYTSASGCQPPTPVTFKNNSTGAGLTYQWSFGDGNTSTLKDPVNNYTNPGTYTVRLIIRNPSGCTDTITKQNAINIGFVKADFTSPASMCAGVSFPLKNTSTPNIVSSQWYFSDGTTSSDINPVKAFAAAGTYTIKLVNNFGSCKDSITKSIQIIGGPDGNFTLTNSSGCSAPHTVSFQNTSVNAVSYLWLFGDNTTSTLKDPTHTYTKPGAYTVKLITTGSNGCTDTVTKAEAVKVVKPRILSINGLPVGGCLPYSIKPTAVIQSEEPVTSYLWDFGDGATSTLANPTHNYNTEGSYDVRLIIKTASGCGDTLLMTNAVQAGTKPVVDFSAEPREACAEISIEFKDLTPGQHQKWFWDFGDGGHSDEPNPSHNYQDTGYFNVLLVVTNYGCVDSIMKTSFVHIIPPIAKFDTTLLCASKLSRTFVNKSVGATSWNWDFGDGTFSNLENPGTHTYAGPGVYKVVLTVSNGMCSHVAKMDVKVVAEGGKLVLDTYATCKSSRVTFDVQNINKANITDYAWFFSGIGGAVVNTKNIPVAQSYTTTGTYTVAVALTDVFGCRDTIKSLVPVNIYGPKAAFASPFAGTCAATEVNFIDSSKTDGTNALNQWVWNFGDGQKQTFTSSPFNHTYNTAGTYNVSLKVVDAFGCKDSITKNAVIVITKPVANFTISDSVLCPGQAVTIANTSTGVQPTYFFDFGDGYTSTAANPTHAYTQEGIFKIFMRMTDKYGCQDSMSYFVRASLAKADYLMSDTFSSCPPLKISFTNKSQNYQSFSWDFGDGGFSDKLDPQHIYTYPGSYTVKLWVKNSGGCTDTLKRTVLIQGPSGTFNYIPTAICNPDVINFTAKTINTVSYVWDFNDGNTILTNSSTASHKYTTPGVYVPKMILADASGCKVPITGPDTIKVNYIKTQIFAQSTVICDSSMVSFYDTTKTNDAVGTFRWDFGDGQFSNERNPVHKYTTPGVFDVKLVATSAFGCKDSTTMQSFIRVAKSPAIAILGDTAACAPGNLSFSAIKTSADTSTLKWGWNFGNGQTSMVQNPAVQTYLSAGSYPLVLSAVNSDGCITAVERTVNINPNPIVDAGPDVLVCKDAPITLNASGANSYVWIADPSLSCVSCASPTVIPNNKQTYRVTGTNAFGCSATDTVVVNVTKPFSMQVDKGDTLCLGSTFKLKASGAQKYQWFPSLYLDDAFSATTNAKPDSSMTYMVIGSDSVNCFADTGYVRVTIRPMEVFIDGNTSACEPANLTFASRILYADTSKLTWNWNFGNGLTDTIANPAAKFFDKAGNYTVKISVSSANGCTSTKEVVAQINPKPLVDAGPDSLVCLNTPLTLKASGAATYVWNTDPSLSCLNCESPVASPTSKKTYIVTGTSQFGCTDTDTVEVSITNPFKMKVGKGDTLCLGSTFNLSVSGADSYQWMPSVFLSDPVSATPTSKPDSSITYRVIGRDSNNCFSDTAFIHLGIRPMEVFIDGITTACEPANLSFKANVLSTDTSALSWSWDFGNGNSVKTKDPGVQKFARAGSYPVKVLVTSAAGCIGTKETIAQINPVPKVDIGRDTSICDITPFNLTATGADAYVWDFKPSLSCLNCASPVARPDSTTTYSVRGSNIFGCTQRDTITLKVYKRFDMQVGVGDTLCLGESTTLKASGAQTYQWSPANFLSTPFAATTKAIPNTTTTFQVIGKDSLGCYADTGSIRIQVFPKPQINIVAGTAVNLNVGSNFKLETKNSTDITKWNWTPAYGLSCTTCPNTVAKPMLNTTYKVTGMNNGGCISTDEIVITVVCNEGTIYIPNTFTPNGDGSNDIFYPRSSANLNIETFRIFNRWGQIMHEKNNISTNSIADGWDGTLNGVKLTPDVYVYYLNVVCGNGNMIPIKGNISLIK